MKKITSSIIIVLLVLTGFGLKAQGCTKVKTNTNITMENGSCIRSINGFDFILEANANSTASLIDRNSTNHVTHATGSQSQDQLYVVGENWHYVSSPMQDEVSGMFLDMYLYDWDEASQTWTWNSPVYIPLTPMKGWALWSPASIGDATRTFEGDFNTGDQSYNLTRNDPNGACPIGANLIGNPYPSSLNWESTSGWTETNVSPTIYLWNSTTGNTGTYNKATNISQNGVDSIIPAKQGFFVAVTSGNSTGSIGVGNDARVHCLNRPVYKAGEKNQTPNVLQLNVSTELTTYSDEALIVFNKLATENYDDLYDAFKMRGNPTAPQLYTDWYGTEYAVNTLKEISQDLTIPLNFEAGINGVYTLDINTNNLPEGTELYLEDLNLNTIQDLISNDTYSFAATTEDDASRFLLHFGAPNGIENDEADGAQIFSFGNTIYINTPKGFSGIVKVYDLLGQEIHSKNIVENNTRFTVNQSNYYIVKLFSASSIQVEKVYVK